MSIVLCEDGKLRNISEAIDGGYKFELFNPPIENSDNITMTNITVNADGSMDGGKVSGLEQISDNNEKGEK